jgi:hypothetical protein
VVVLVDVVEVDIDDVVEVVVVELVEVDEVDDVDDVEVVGTIVEVVLLGSRVVVATLFLWVVVVFGRTDVVVEVVSFRVEVVVRVREVMRVVVLVGEFPGLTVVVVLEEVVVLFVLWLAT